MAELLEVVVSWPALLLVLLVFGFAPGFVLRTLVILYPPGDPRRSELVAELYVVPVLMRPLWVAQQCETALFEGISARWSVLRAKRKESAERTRRSRLSARAQATMMWGSALAVLGLLGFVGFQLFRVSGVSAVGSLVLLGCVALGFLVAAGLAGRRSLRSLPRKPASRRSHHLR